MAYAMKLKITTLLILSMALTSFGAIEQRIDIGLEKPQNTIRLSLTEATDATVSARIKRYGADYDITGWIGLLWYGNDDGGVTLTNSAASRGIMSWDVDSSMMPTNGRYSVMMFGVNGERNEEWGSGILTVRLNPAKDSLPAQWSTGGESYSIATNAISLIGIETAGRIVGDAAVRSELLNSNALLRAEIDGISVEESDPRAMKLYHYGNADIDITPTNAFEFAISDGEATITGYSGDYADIVIPYEFYGVPVTAAGDNVFSSKGSAQTITGSRNLTTIGYGFAAFCYQNLTSIVLPTATTIGGAFAENCSKLTSIVLSSATTIGNSFAYFCGSLTSIALPNATTIDSSFVSSCDKLTRIEFAAPPPTLTGTIPYGTVYVTNPQAQGWGDTFGGRPVVFPNGRYDDLTVKNISVKDKFLVYDTSTNLVWNIVPSNGWMYLVAYTNTPTAGGQ